MTLVEAYDGRTTEQRWDWVLSRSQGRRHREGRGPAGPPAPGRRQAARPQVRDRRRARRDRATAEGPGHRLHLGRRRPGEIGPGHDRRQEGMTPSSGLSSGLIRRVRRRSGAHSSTATPQFRTNLVSSAVALTGQYIERPDRLRLGLCQRSRGPQSHQQSQRDSWSSGCTRVGGFGHLSDVPRGRRFGTGRLGDLGRSTGRPVRSDGHRPGLADPARRRTRSVGAGPVGVRPQLYVRAELDLDLVGRVGGSEKAYLPTASLPGRT